MAKSSVIFDCERMKHLHSGFFYFCGQLGKALLEEATKSDDISFFIPKKLEGYFGENVAYKRVNPLYKLYLPTCGAKVWHAAYQTTPYLPLRAKVVLTVHDLNFLYERNEEDQKKYRKRLQYNVDHSDVIVTISQYVRKDLEEHIDTHGKEIHVIYNGRNTFTGDITIPKEAPKRPFLFSIGMMLPKKNFHVLPQLLIDNDMELVIAGKQLEYIDRIRQAASQCGVADRLHLVGTISDGEKYWYMKNCTAFVFPSIAEGFGLPVIEAMSCGKPVFISQYTSLPEIGGDMAYYFNKDFDGAAMRQELEEGLADFHNNNKAEASRQYANRFSWTNAAKAYWEIYKSLM